MVVCEDLLNENICEKFEDSFNFDDDNILQKKLRI